MKRRSLRATLLHHWLSFAFLTGLAAIATAAVVAYVVEDRLIDQRLEEALAHLPTDDLQPGTLPPGFALYPEAVAPGEVTAALTGKRPGNIVEVQMADGTYVHAVAIERAGRAHVLVFDASETLVVQPFVPVAAVMALGFLATFVAIAALIANALGRRVAKGSDRLLRELETCRTPQEVALLAERQQIAEMAAFLSVHAQVWETRIRALQEQEDMVAFLAHELRTPLQSARASLAVLRDDVPASPVLDRLDRAVSRLARASNATLFIGAEAELASQGECSIFAIWNDLRTEFAPLAEKRGQRIGLAAGSDRRVAVPREAVEAILANLLGNAIGHGAPGAIKFQGDGGVISIRNPSARERAPGFGLGLTIVQRLAAKLGWTTEIMTVDDMFEVRIELDAGGRP